MKHPYTCQKLALIVVLLITAGIVKAEENKQPKSPSQKDNFMQATEFTNAEKNSVIQSLSDYKK